jgi:hypothetical protein
MTFLGMDESHCLLLAAIVAPVGVLGAIALVVTIFTGKCP